jgi:hypothetical protein
VVGEVEEEDATNPGDGNNTNATEVSLRSALRALGEHVWRRGGEWGGRGG